jgi:hypothetical protein
MSYSATRLSAIGMMVFLTPLAFAGCFAQESDEVATDESVSEQTALVTCRVRDQRLVTCQSGWPGNRVYQIGLASPTDIIPGTISVAFDGPNGELSHSVSQSGTRQINFTAIIREGDAFNPGKATTTYIVSWCRQ